MLPIRLLLTACLLVFAISPASAADPPPNIVFFFVDNLGYGDVGCFGSKLHRTPHIDRMAEEGTKFTHYYVTSGVCTPSRSSLMTGCYPRRVGLHQNDRGGGVLQPVEPIGLHPDEITVATLLKQEGYKTAIIGKWHLGDQAPFLPTRHGFDFFYGIPYSDDMTPRDGQIWPPLPLMRNDTVIQAPMDRNELTKRYTHEAIRFMEENRDQPFFLYIPHAMPGSTRWPYASPDFQGRSANGAWGDSVEELDWSTGEVLAAIKRLGLDERTLVVWTSDNGAPRRDPPQGSNAPLGGWGYTTAEGGMRVPCVMRWPGKIPAGRVCEELVTTLDMLPTFARLAGTEPPQDRIIDGRDVLSVLLGEPGAKTPHEAFYYYHRGNLEAVRSGPYKLYVPIARERRNNRPPQEIPPRLYDVAADPGETTDLIDKRPEIVRKLNALAELAREDIGDGDRQGRGQRPVGRVENPVPLVLGMTVSATTD